MSQINLVLAGNEIWPLDRPDGMPTINSLEVMCGKDHMDVHVQFSAPFDGIVSSKGMFFKFFFSSKPTKKTHFRLAAGEKKFMTISFYVDFCT